MKICALDQLPGTTTNYLVVVSDELNVMMGDKVIYDTIYGDAISTMIIDPVYVNENEDVLVQIMSGEDEPISSILRPVKDFVKITKDDLDRLAVGRQWILDIGANLILIKNG